MNSILFTRWLRAKQLPILLSFLLLALSIMQSVHDQSHHDALHSVVNCEYCVLSQGLDAAVLPTVISSASNFVNDAAVALYAFCLLPVYTFQQRARAPPQSILSNR